MYLISKDIFWISYDKLHVVLFCPANSVIVFNIFNSYRQQFLSVMATPRVIMGSRDIVFSGSQKLEVRKTSTRCKFKEKGKGSRSAKIIPQKTPDLCSEFNKYVK